MAAGARVTPAAKTLPAGGATEASDIPHASLPVSALATGERRLDGETYLTSGYGIRLQIEANARHQALSDLADIWQPPRLKGIGVAPDHGMPFLTATQVFDIRPTPRKWLAPSKTPKLAQRLVERDWILVTCSGTVGDAIVSYGPHLNAIISHDLLRLQVRRKEQLGFLYAFIRSRYGKQMLRSSHYGSIVKHLEPEHLFDIPVPATPVGLQERLNNQIRQVFGHRDKAHRVSAEAERLFADALALDLPDTSNLRTFDVPASEMFSGRRRLDANHYNPTARVIEQALRSSGLRIGPLGDVVERILLPNRFKRVYMGEGIPYLDSEDIFKINPEITKFIPASSKKDASRYFVKRDWLLVARSGQTYGLNGSVMLASSWHEDKIISEHIIRVIPSASSPPSGYLQVAMGHPQLGRPLVLRLPFGSSVPEIAPEDLATVPLVRLGSSLEAEIAALVEQATEERAAADEEEAAAVRSFEEHVKRSLHAEPKAGEHATSA